MWYVHGTVGVVRFFHLSMSGMRRLVQEAFRVFDHPDYPSLMVFFLSSFLIPFLVRGGASSGGSSANLALILALSSARKSTGGMSAKRKAASSDTVL